MTPKVHVVDLNYLDQKCGIAVFIIESDEGPILVETGPHSRLDAVVEALGTLGYQKEDVRHVFVTHIHLDHAGAAWCFAEHGAKIYLHPKGFRHMHDPSKLLASAKMIYKDMMDYLWGTLKPIPEDLLIQVEHLGEVEIAGYTFISHHTQGHAQHHIAWQVGSILFTGDVAGVRINQGPIVPPCPPPDINREDWIASIDHILSLKEVDTYYLTHFGEVKDIKPHMKQLTNAVNSYTDFMEPYAQADTPTKEILPEFTAFVKKYLVDHGMSQSDADSYEAANPSYMSVAGLMRYWKKKNAV